MLVAELALYEGRADQTIEMCARIASDDRDLDVIARAYFLKGDFAKAADHFGTLGDSANELICLVRDRSRDSLLRAGEVIQSARTSTEDQVLSDVADSAINELLHVPAVASDSDLRCDERVGEQLADILSFEYLRREGVWLLAGTASPYVLVESRLPRNIRTFMNARVHTIVSGLLASRNIRCRWDVDAESGPCVELEFAERNG